jgi:alanyl-tRNA synthetase
MSKTERLYYNDSHLVEFEARVLESTGRVSGWSAIKLDRTAFYPTGGGQPSDTGTINGARVVECIDEESEGITHVIHGATFEVGQNVKGVIDWEKRFDHLQQHTGQHILSQSFVKLFNAETHSFRMMENISEIDVALDDPTDARIERAIELANKIIWENHPIVIRNVTENEAASLPLRKESSRHGELRLIEIEGFDLTPCGGTHAKQTGEVGIIVVRSWSRAKGMTRIEFAAGHRALHDYNKANQTARDVALQFSIGRDEAPAAVTRIIEEHKNSIRRLRTLEELAIKVEAEELKQQATILEDETKIISKHFEGRDAESLKRIAHTLIEAPKTVVFLSSQEDETVRLVFARSSDSKGDMNLLMKEACAALDGRGGGKPDMAQGGGKNVEKISEVLASAIERYSQTSQNI